MKYLIKIQSYSDIITNSSSEIFMFKAPGYTSKELQKLLDDFHEKHSVWNSNISWEDFKKLPDEVQETYDAGSGMGGLVQVFGPHDRYKSYCKYGYTCEEDCKDYDNTFVSNKLSYDKYINEIDNDECDGFGGEDRFMLDIDWRNDATINLVKEMFDDVQRVLD